MCEMKPFIKDSMPDEGAGSTRKIFILVIIFILVSLLTGIALAQNGFDLSWWSVDGGGHTSSSGGVYTLGGTIGQPDAWELSGGIYNLSGGFWVDSTTGIPQHLLYLPLIIRQP
jgi:hypothetical protein